MPALGDELQHEQRGNRPGVGLVEVAEVVVAGDLAAEERAFLAHALLDEGVADPVDERRAAVLLDDVRHRPARPHVVDDLRAGLLLEHGLGEERGHEVAGDELPGVVHEEAAVGVAVEGDPEVGLLFLHLADDELAVLGKKRVRLVVGERAVRLEETAHRVHGQTLEDGRQHRARHTVSGVDDDPKRLDRRRRR